MIKKQKKFANHNDLDLRVRKLYEVTGRYGPWTQAEFVATFPPFAPERAPRPTPPPEVQKLLDEADTARLDFDAAQRTWIENVQALRAAQSQSVGGLSFQFLGDQAKAKETAALERELSASFQACETAREALEDARRQMNKAEFEWLRSLNETAGE